MPPCLPTHGRPTRPAQTETRAGRLAPINALMPEALIAAAIGVVDMVR